MCLLICNLILFLALQSILNTPQIRLFLQNQLMHAKLPPLCFFFLFKNKCVFFLRLIGFETYRTNGNNYDAEDQIVYPFIETYKETLYNFGATGFPRLLTTKNSVRTMIASRYTYGGNDTIVKDFNQLLTK